MLARELGVRDQQLLSELLRMMQDERKKLDGESSLQNELRRNDESEWREKPEMVDYCGFREADGIYLMHEIKNPDGGCKDYTDRTPTLRHVHSLSPRKGACA